MVAVPIPGGAPQVRSPGHVATRTGIWPSNRSARPTTEGAPSRRWL